MNPATAPPEQVVRSNGRVVVPLWCPGDPSTVVRVDEQRQDFAAIRDAPPSDRAIADCRHDELGVIGDVELQNV